VAPTVALPLARTYVARGGAPEVRAVDVAIFERRYYGHCMACSFCGDSCCQHGVDVSVVERDRILAEADRLAPLVRAPREQWFVPGEVPDADFPGGAATRTAVVDGGCVFLRAGARGCALHAFSLSRGEDYHALKPMVSALFPVTFGDGTLLCSEELVDGTLSCTGDGPTAYAMARGELGYYFGAELVAELDAIAASRAGS
jgi:Fe-S-cluster containining protein